MGRKEGSRWSVQCRIVPPHNACLWSIVTCPVDEDKHFPGHVCRCRSAGRLVDHINYTEYRNRGMSSRVCSVCSKGNASYRCPKCKISYCSKDCCKIHQERSCPHYASIREQSIKETSSIPSEEREKERNQSTTLTKENSEPSHALIHLHAPPSTRKPTIDDRVIKLTEEQKRLLSSSSELKALMGRKRFLDDLDKIDTALNRADTLKKLRSNNLEFNIAMEKILSIVQGSCTKG